MDYGAINYNLFIEGDETAFEELIDMYHDSLIFFINGYVHNITIAEDIAIDTFAELIIKKKKYTWESSFKTFLFAIAKNKAVDYFRKEGRNVIVPIENIAEMSDDTLSLEQTVLKNERKRFVNKAMQKLKQQQREVLYLFYIEDMSYAEIAVILGKSKKQVDHLLYNSKKSLKLILQKEEFDFYDE